MTDKPERVQIPAWNDRWMMGDRYGEVVRVFKHRELGHEIAVVRLDKSGKTIRVIYDDCTVV